MQKLTFNSTEEWLVARRGKATGSRAGDLVPGPRTKGHTAEFYKMMAERYADPIPEDTNPREWGHQVEPFALLRFMEETGKRIEFGKIMWVSDDNPLLAISPDGPIADVKDTEAVEVKSFYPENHLKVLLDNKIPDTYREQALWYFVVNNKLKTLYFVAYCPLFYDEHMQMVVIEMHRKDIEEEVEQLKQSVLQEIAAMDTLVVDLATSRKKVDLITISNKKTCQKQKSKKK
jgi:hypothetical protein